MKFNKIPVLMPYNLWGHAGATGTFMFYNPPLDTYLIGSFNNFAYEKKAVRIMVKLLHKFSKKV